MAIKSLNDPRYHALIQQLVARRKELRWSQEKLADKLGRWQQFVSKYEGYDRRLDIIEYLDVAHALDLDGAAEALRLWSPVSQER